LLFLTNREGAKDAKGTLMDADDGYLFSYTAFGIFAVGSFQG